MSHIIENYYLEFYNCDILLAYIVDLVKNYQEDHQMSQSKMICYL